MHVVGMFTTCHSMVSPTVPSYSTNGPDGGDGGGGGGGGLESGGGGSGDGDGSDGGGGNGGGEFPVEVCVSEIQGIRFLIIASDSVFILLCILCTLSVVFFSFFEKKSPVVYYKHYR